MYFPIKKSKRNIASFSIIFLLIYFEFSFIYSDLGISAAYGALVFAAFCLFVLFGKRTYKINNGWNTSQCLMMFAVFIIILINFFRVNQYSTDYYYLCIWALCMIILFSVDKAEETHCNKVKNIAIICAVLMAVFQIIHKMNPRIIEPAIYSIMDINNVAYSKNLVNQGYGFVLGRSVDVTALIMVLGLGAALEKCFECKKNKKNLLAILLILIGLIVFQRRGEALASIAALFLSAWITESKNGKIKKWQLVLILFIIILSLALLFIIDNLPDYSSNRFIMTIVGLRNGESVGNGRTTLYILALNAFWENPVFGIGWNGFARNYAMLSRITLVQNVHNIYLQLFCECGIVGATIIISCLVAILRKTIQLKFQCTYQIKFGLYLQLFILIYGLTDNPFYRFYFPIFYTISIIMSFKRNGKQQDKEWT